MISCFRINNELSNKDQSMENLTRNGRMLLEKLIAFTNGRGNSIGRSFSLNDLNIATQNYDSNQVIFSEGLYILYTGFLHNRKVIVKKYKDETYLKDSAIKYQSNLEDCISDIVFSSQTKTHNHILKLLGCCFDSSIPILVFEDAEKRSLDDYIYNSNDRLDFRPLSWKNRVKIAVDVANVIAYLHTAFSRPVIHRGIKTKLVLLDEDYGAQLSDFSLAISMPEGETYLNDDVKGTTGYTAPEYARQGTFNEKIDVYSFGVLLLVLLTRQKPYNPFPDFEDEYYGLVDGVSKRIETDRLQEIIDETIFEDGTWYEKEQQIRAFVRVALHCTSKDPEDRPDITDVGKQLREMYQSLISN
ncbi:Wall-associated kinase family protein [Euphorbia peplus]|nr:Wall-associated kinase family protein [Euphorbia peplus]